MFRRVRVGSGADPVPLREVRRRRPRLLAVEQPAANAVPLGATAFSFIDAASEPASGSLYPTANSTSLLEDLGQELLLQLLAAVADKRLADDPDALADLGSAAAGERFVQQELVDTLAVLSAVLLRPGHPEPAASAKLLHERARASACRRSAPCSRG